LRAGRRADQRGQILVLSALVMTFLFIPLAIFLIDTSLVESAYAQLGETLQASAEDGASMVDEGTLRSSNGQTVVLDPALARTTADRSMGASHLAGLVTWTSTATGQRITVTATVSVPLMVLGTARLTSSRSATFAYGP
jgi:Flp pilus assembly protein TadG